MAPPLVTSSKLEAMSASDDNESASAIGGTFVSVQWDDSVYEGSVTAFDEHRQHSCICYDDRDIEWMKIPYKDVELLSTAAAGTSDGSLEPPFN